MTRGERRINLTPLEFRLLVCMAQQPGRVFSRPQLVEQVWGQPAGYYDDKSVNVHIRRLREKIEVHPADPRILRTVPGIGYRLEA